MIIPHLLIMLERPSETVSTQAPNGASRAVGTHHGPTRIHLADYSLRHRRDYNAGTTMLYHPRNYRRQHSSSVMTAGCRELLEHGHRRRIRRSRRTFRGTTGRTEQRADPEYTAASGRRDHATFGSGPTRQSDDRDSVNTRSQTTYYVRRGTGRVVHCLIIAHSFLGHRSLKIKLGPSCLKDIAATPTS